MPSQLSSSSSGPWSDMASAPKPFEKDEPIRELRPPICGDGLRKLLSSKSTMRSPSRKSCTNPRLSSGRIPSDKQSLLVGAPTAETGGSKSRGLKLTGNRNGDNITEGRIARSPSNDSTSTSSDSGGLPKRNRRMLSEFLTTATTGRDGEGHEVAPYYVLQFDPSGSADSSSPRKMIEEDKPTVPRKTYDKEKGQEEKRQINDLSGSEASSYSSLSVQRMPHRSSRKKGKPAAWSTSLPSVAEENIDDGSTQSANSPSSGSPINADIMRAMRSLVRKQQKSIEDMEIENKRFREELADYRRMLSEAHRDRTKQEDQIGALTAEKKTTESATLWLREEMKALKTEIARMKEESQSNKPYFPRAQEGDETYKRASSMQSTIEKDPELAQFAEVKKAIYGSILEVDSLLKSKSEDSFADSGVFTTDDKRDDTTAASSSMSFSENDRQDDDHYQRMLNRSLGSSSESFVRAIPSDSSTRRGVDPSQSNAARSKEEVTLFKTRLEAIQKKREERKIREGDFGSRSGRISFD